MGARSRSRYSDFSIKGSYYYGDTASTSNKDPMPEDNLVSETCADVTMPRPYTVDHGFNMTKTVRRPTVINGSKTLSSGLKKITYNGYRHQPSPQLSYAFTPPNLSQYRTLALANLSPYRSKLNTPLFLFELRELPGMIQQLGRVLKKQVRKQDVAGGYLAYSFGWAPLVSDLLKLFDMSKAVEDRKAYFRRLESGTHMRRQLGTHVVRNTTTPTSWVAHTYTGPSLDQGYSYANQGRLVETQKVWYTTNAKLRSPGHMSNADLHSLSATAIHGLRINPSNIWDAIPWSWLIDYFGNIGDTLEAMNGMTAVSVTRMNLMIMSKIVISYEDVHRSAGIEVEPGFYYSTWKQRYPYAVPLPSVSFDIPFFTNHMSGILGSLATVKALKAFGVR